MRASQPPLGLLLVEDSADDALLVTREIERAGYAVDSVRVDTREGLEEALDRRFDIVVVDYSLPGFTGSQALRVLADREPDLPAIVVSGTIEEQTAVEAMRAGARDFVTKQNMARLGAVVERELAEAEARRSQRQTQGALRKSEARFQSVIENSLDIFSIVDCDGRYLYTSPSFEQALGYSPAEVLGIDRLTLIHPDDRERIRNAFETQLASKETGGLVAYRIRHRDGSWRRLESISINLVGDPAVAGVVLTSRDVTERRFLEEQLERTRRLDAIGQLAGGVAHDFNNVLLVVRGYAAILCEELRGTPHEGKVGEILKAADRAAELTRQLLAFGRRQAFEPRILDVNDVIAGMETLLRGLLPEDVELIVLPSDESAVVRADVGQVEQVLANLATNARDAMPHGGAITIAVEIVDVDGPVPEIRPKQLALGTYVAVRVSDTGTGIGDEALAHMFEPFFTTKPHGEGSGFGLPTVYGIVTQSGGAISVDTSTSAGSTFVIYLPAAHDAPVETVPEETDLGVDGTETVLLVEDERQVRDLVRAMLEEHGYRVLVASGPSEALELASARSGDIDILVSDVVIPEMSGYDLAEALRRSRPDLRSLFMSGYARGLRAVGDEADAGILLQKPFGASDLTRALRRALDSSPQEPQQ